MPPSSAAPTPRIGGPVARFALLLTLLLPALPDALAAPPQRIVSLNLCTDQLLLDLVAPERIAALSTLAADPQLSTIARRAPAFRATHGSAEEALALEPDLVLTAEYAAPTTVDLLRRLGRRVVTVPQAETFEGIRVSIRAVAAATQDVARGDALIADFDRRLATLSARASGPIPGSGSAADRRLTALSWEINALSAGAATLIDAAMTAAGLDNLARRLRLGRGGQLPLEQIVATPPDILVLANAADDYRTVAADNLAHPALAKAVRGRQTVHIGMPLWLCGSPRTLDAVEALVNARDAVLAPLSR